MEFFQRVEMNQSLFIAILMSKRDLSTFSFIDQNFIAVKDFTKNRVSHGLIFNDIYFPVQNGFQLFLEIHIVIKVLHRI